LIPALSTSSEEKPFLMTCSARTFHIQESIGGFRGGRLTARRFTVTAATSGVIKVGMTIIVQPAETAR
jgi:hypothetical protein